MLPDLKEEWLKSQLDTSPYLPLVVIDFKVYAHIVNGFAESVEHLAEGDESKIRAVIKALWAYRLNRGVDSLPSQDFTAIVVDDNKTKFGGTEVVGYWRHLEAHKLQMPEYKGGRPDKPSLFPLVLEEGYKYIQSPGSTFEFFDKPGYEADDIAGKVARIQRTDPVLDRYILLSTVDGDWQGLVSDKHKIVWCNTGPWLPRIRTEKEVCDYYLRKEKLNIKTARETYTVKVEVGDSGDNLLPGTPLRFFDLYDEDPVWGWTPEEETRLRDLMSNVSVSNRKDHLERSARFLSGIGMFLPEIPPPNEHDILIYAEKSKRERREALNPDLRGRNKKYCVNLKLDADFVKCAKVAVDDDAARVRIKELEELRKEKDSDYNPGLLKALKDSRKDYKASLLRYGAK